MAGGSVTGILPLGGGQQLLGDVAPVLLFRRRRPSRRRCADQRFGDRLGDRWVFATPAVGGVRVPVDEVLDIVVVIVGELVIVGEVDMVGEAGRGGTEYSAPTRYTASKCAIFRT